MDMGSFIDILLEIFPEADRFVLIGPSATYENGEMVSCFPLTPSQANRLLDQVIDEETSSLKHRFNQMSKQEKAELPTFDVLISNIKSDVKTHVQKVCERRLEPDESPYACDEFGEGKMHYKQPTSLWHFYHSIGSIYESVIPILDKMVAHKEKMNPLEVFNNAKHERIRHSLINYEPSFSWHCTKTSLPAIVYHFKLDANAFVWLSSRQDIYDFDLLDDFALYQGDKLLFSSCTHERFCDAIGSKNPL